MFADSTDDDILTLNPEGMNALANRTNTSAGSIDSYGEQAITGNVLRSTTRPAGRGDCRRQQRQ